MAICNIKDFTSIGIRVNYLFFDTTALEITRRVAQISKGEARRKIKQGGVYFGNDRLADPNELITPGNAAVTLFIGKEFKGIII